MEAPGVEPRASSFSDLRATTTYAIPPNIVGREGVEPSPLVFQTSAPNYHLRYQPKLISFQFLSVVNYRAELLIMDFYEVIYKAAPVPSADTTKLIVY